MVLQGKLWHFFDLKAQVPVFFKKSGKNAGVFVTSPRILFLSYRTAIIFYVKGFFMSIDDYNEIGRAGRGNSSAMRRGSAQRLAAWP